MARAYSCLVMYERRLRFSDVRFDRDLGSPRSARLGCSADPPAKRIRYAGHRSANSGACVKISHSLSAMPTLGRLGSIAPCNHPVLDHVERAGIPNSSSSFAMFLGYGRDTPVSHCLTVLGFSPNRFATSRLVQPFRRLAARTHPPNVSALSNGSFPRYLTTRGM